MSDAAILFIDLAGFQPLPARDVLKTVGHGANIQAVTDENAAVTSIQQAKHLDIVLVNAPKMEVLAAVRKYHPQARSILATDLPMDMYSRMLDGAEDAYLDHIISNRPMSEWTINEVRVTVQKILTKDIFGIEKYLAPGAQVHSITVQSSGKRDEYNSQVMAFAERCRLNSHMAKLIWGISEELLMNSIYDAPAAAGIQKYMKVPRSIRVDLDPSEFATLTYGCDGQVFALSSSDPFGLLSQSKLFEYVKKVLRRSDSSSIIDTKEGGAGLGIFKILYSSHALVCNVQKNKRSEIMALINIDEQLRDFSKLARSIHYFAL